MEIEPGYAEMLEHWPSVRKLRFHRGQAYFSACPVWIKPKVRKLQQVC